MDIYDEVGKAGRLFLMNIVIITSEFLADAGETSATIFF